MISSEHLWRGLLALRDALRTHDGPVIACVLQWQPALRVFVNVRPKQAQQDDVWVMFEDPVPEDIDPSATVFKFESVYTFWLVQTGGQTEDAVAFLKQYLPYAVLSVWAARFGRTVAVSHFAQTLDAKIATASGDSKWIGDAENLIHAHRMRALCDAILIGRGTLEHDTPALTVRHVPGPHPQRVVLCSSETDYQSLMASCPDDILILGTAPCPEDLPGQLQYRQMPMHDGRMDSHAVLAALYRRGLQSVYIEGGSQTTSTFLQERALDVLQLHFAPMVMGAGLSSFAFSGAQVMADAVEFVHSDFYPVGEGYLFTGELAQPA